MNISEIQHLCDNTLISHLGIEFTLATPGEVRAIMPVTASVKQPFGAVHGGAYVTLLETAASVGANLNVDLERHYCVGMEVNANHLRAVTAGQLTATALPIHLGKHTQVWGVDIRDDQAQRACVGRITMAVINRSP
jgi:1,4-dihydroxy-2-naphthoyl-CoA hydrolase